MAAGLWLFVGWMALVAIMAFGFFVWGYEHGQFDDVETPARRMLLDHDAAAQADQEVEKHDR
jgi:cbb3-type cytochrome oxidase maturation protein